jgi:bacterioferritin-associated ferredoxin
MKLCICRNISDKTFNQHLLDQAGTIACAEAALTQCSGDPTNCGKCLEMADEMVFSHNRRVETIRELQNTIPLPSEQRETV